MSIFRVLVWYYKYELPLNQKEGKNAKLCITILWASFMWTMLCMPQLEWLAHFVRAPHAIPLDSFQSWGGLIKQLLVTAGVGILIWAFYYLTWFGRHYKRVYTALELDPWHYARMRPEQREAAAQKCLSLLIAKHQEQVAVRVAGILHPDVIALTRRIWRVNKDLVSFHLIPDNPSALRQLMNEPVRT